VTFRAVLAFALLSPSLGRACDVCMQASNSSVQQAFMFASLFLSLTPLVLVGGFVWWLRRRAQRFAAEEAAGVIHLPTATARPTRRAS
jgi:hypothetical protein